MSKATKPVLNLKHFILKQEVKSLYRKFFRIIKQVHDPAHQNDLKEWVRHDFRSNAHHTDEITIKMYIKYGERCLKELENTVHLSNGGGESILTKVMDLAENNVELGDKKSYAGIPEAEFVEDVDAYMSRPENNKNVDEVLKKLDSQHAKYKFMEYNLLSKKKRLQNQVPELKRSLTMIEKLEQQKEEFETQFLLSEQVFAKAKVPPTDTVYLWLGANVMLEYSLKDAQELLTQNIAAATRNLNYVEHDLDFLRDQFTTTEVNMARVFNWDVKRRQAAKAAAK